MADFIFGVKTDRMSKAEMGRRERAAKKHGVRFHVVHGNSGHCMCGHGCKLDSCKIVKTWFSTENLGEPHDGRKAREVEAELTR